MRTLTVSFGLLALASASFAASAPQRPPIVGIANMAVKSNDMEKSRTFYTKHMGFAEAYKFKPDKDSPERVVFKVNDHQYIQVSPELKGETEDRMIQMGYETKDAKKLRDYLASKGWTVPAKVTKGPDGNLSFKVKDPDNYTVEFVQYLPGSLTGKTAGKFMPDTRVSDHMLHVGMRIKDEAASDKFYKDILGFRPLWKGGPTDTRFDWISMLVPDGTDWVEYMANSTNPTPQQLGVLNHFCLQSMDLQKVHKTVVDRGYVGNRVPAIGRDGRWLLQLYDPNLTRAEFMIRKPVEKPCCSEMHDVDESGHQH